MRIVLVGFGSVGKALASLIEQRRDELYRAHGLAPRLVCVIDSGGAAVGPRGLSARDLMDAKATGTVANIAEVGLTGIDAPRLIRDTAADVLVETSPSVIKDPRRAIEHLKSAFASGKHAVSVNKAPLAVALPALNQLARYNRVLFRYSGTVGAGTPVLATARTLSAGDRILKVRGILNGTTNFILHRMAEQGDSYAAALAEAVRLGYAETDPSADVDGIDTATKVVIIASAVLGLDATIDDVSITGIRDIARERVLEAQTAGQSLKLIGEIDAATGKLSVSPQTVERHGPMDVPRNVNAVEFTLENSGAVTLVGRGAGGPETATAILRDLVDIWHESGHP